MVLLELFSWRKKKNRASYGQPWAWLDGLPSLLWQPTPLYV
jgi:hypothetical protein